MGKSKTKSDYINQLLGMIQQRANKLTVKQIKELIARHA